MATKWVQRIKDRLAENPLFWTLEGTFPHEKGPCICQQCANKQTPENGTRVHGGRVPLYRVTNYGHEFDHCYMCGTKYT